jgi:hypothetical protein
MSAPVSRDLDDEINASVENGFPVDILYLGFGKEPLAIKYIPARWSNVYHRPGQKLKISDTPGFTWGRATYVTSLTFPLSTAIFGRAGVIARFNPYKWRTFDATVTENRELYIRWLQAQPLYQRFVLSAQSAYISQLLRDSFRLRYRIDCVLFRPDQSNPRYTKTASDIWMAVTDWTPMQRPRIATGSSERFQEPRLTVVIEEEFEDKMGGIHRAGVLNLASAWPKGNLSDLFAQAYHDGRIERITS